MELVSTNRLRVSLNDARKYYAARGFVSYRSNDHDRGTEYNYSITLGWLWLHVKFRPQGKRGVLREGDGK